MKVTKASEDLYKSLAKYDEVIGTGVEVVSDRHFIVVYLKKLTRFIKSKIPRSYEGNQVKTEITGPFSAFNF
jgi:hypothetical protein